MLDFNALNENEQETFEFLSALLAIYDKTNDNPALKSLVDKGWAVLTRPHTYEPSEAGEEAYEHWLDTRLTPAEMAEMEALGESFTLSLDGLDSALEWIANTAHLILLVRSGVTRLTFVQEAWHVYKVPFTQSLPFYNEMENAAISQNSGGIRAFDATPAQKPPLQVLERSDGSFSVYRPIGNAHYVIYDSLDNPKEPETPSDEERAYQRAIEESPRPLDIEALFQGIEKGDFSSRSVNWESVARTLYSQIRETREALYPVLHWSDDLLTMENPPSWATYSIGGVWADLKPALIAYRKLGGK